MSTPVISQQQMMETAVPLIKMQGIVHKKFKKVLAKRALGGEKITTITSDGTETENQAVTGDFIVKNQTKAGELYILEANKFQQLYKFDKNVAHGFAQYHPLGKVIALQMTSDVLESLNLETQLLFMAPWGKPEVMKQNDFLVCPLDCHQVYRIARREFTETYEVDQDT